jgi:hypothetical protein
MNRLHIKQDLCAARLLRAIADEFLAASVGRTLVRNSFGNVGSKVPESSEMLQRKHNKKAVPHRTERHFSAEAFKLGLRTIFRTHRIGVRLGLKF